MQTYLFMFNVSFVLNGHVIQNAVVHRQFVLAWEYAGFFDKRCLDAK